MVSTSLSVRMIALACEAAADAREASGCFISPALLSGL